MPYIKVNNYEHINRSFKNWNTPNGRYIRSKADYEKALHEEGMVTEKQARDMGYTDTPKTKQRYELSNKSKSLLESVRNTKDVNGKIRPTQRQIAELKQQFKYNSQILKELGL